MKLLVIGTNKFAYGPVQIQTRARELGWQAECIEYQDVSFEIKKKEIQVICKSNPLGELDVLILRSASSSKHSHYDFSRLRQAIASFYLDEGKALIINEKIFSKFCGVYDKLTQAIVLHKAGLPTVDSKIYGGFSFQVEKKTLPLLFKPISGSHGFGVKKINSQQSFDRYQATLFPWKTIVQPYINVKSDFRVLVVGEKVVGAINRKNAYKLGLETNNYPSEFIQVIGDTKLERLAIEAVRALELQFAGVDVIEDEDGNRFILEVNDSAGYKRLDSVCQTDTANILLEYISRHRRNTRS